MKGVGTMNIKRTYPCQLRLYNVSDGTYSPPVHQVTLELYLPSKKQSIFVVFNFNSIDDVWIYLKSLTRKYGNCAVEKLFCDYYPATVELSEDFEFLATFEKLLLPDETVWPSEKFHGFILQN